MDRVGATLNKGARATTYRWSPFGIVAASAESTVTTPMADDAITEKSGNIDRPTSPIILNCED